MGLFTWLKGKWNMLFKKDIRKVFDTKTYLSSEMESAIELWRQLESGKPPWVDKDTRTIRFSNTVARELAKLVTQNIDIKVQARYGNGEKSAFIQSKIDAYFLKMAQEIIEKQIRLGGVMAKWNGKGIDYLPPTGRFIITSFDSNRDVDGAEFYDYYTEKDKYYTRVEWHRFETANRRNEETGQTEAVRIYHISNKAFVADSWEDMGREISLKNTKWADIVPEWTAENIEKPLFAYLKNPYSNTIDPDSPLGVSAFSECMEELRWLDIAMSTMGKETEQSEPKMFVDRSSVIYAKNNGIKLPEFISGLEMGINAENTIQQWQPTLQVTSRTEGINFLLSIISFKLGFDQGTFVFNGQKIVMATATQVETSEQKTVNTVASYRCLLDRPDSNGDGRIGFIHDICYIIDTMVTINGQFLPTEYGNYELFCDFADITKNKQEDMLFDYQLAQNGYMSKARFLVMHRGYTEEEALAMVKEAQEESAAGQGEGLFGEE